MPNDGAISLETLREAAAGQHARVLVDLPSGPCWCRLVRVATMKADKGVRVVVDVTGVQIRVSPAAIRDLTV